MHNQKYFFLLFFLILFACTEKDLDLKIEGCEVNISNLHSQWTGQTNDCNDAAGHNISKAGRPRIISFHYDNGGVVLNSQSNISVYYRWKFSDQALYNKWEIKSKYLHFTTDSIWFDMCTSYGQADHLDYDIFMKCGGGDESNKLTSTLKTN